MFLNKRSPFDRLGESLVTFRGGSLAGLLPAARGALCCREVGPDGVFPQLTVLPNVAVLALGPPLNSYPVILSVEKHRRKCV